MQKAILCVDDEEIILESLREQLEKSFGSSYIYETAENAEEGIEIVDELSNDGISVLIIVSDWLMPGIKGDEFLIKVHQKYPDIVTVMLTGQADERSIEKAKNYANLYAVVHKPWAEEELVEIIRSGLER